jgi:hypothetical protein
MLAQAVPAAGRSASGFPIPNVGLKPHAQVKDEMARFMAEVAATFA